MNNKHAHALHLYTFICTHIRHWILDHKSKCHDINLENCEQCWTSEIRNTRNTQMRKKKPFAHKITWKWKFIEIEKVEEKQPTTTSTNCSNNALKTKCCDLFLLLLFIVFTQSVSRSILTLPGFPFSRCFTPIESKWITHIEHCHMGDSCRWDRVSHAQSLSNVCTHKSVAIDNLHIIQSGLTCLGSAQFESTCIIKFSIQILKKESEIEVKKSKTQKKQQRQRIKSNSRPSRHAHTHTYIWDVLQFLWQLNKNKNLNKISNKFFIEKWYANKIGMVGNSINFQLAKFRQFKANGFMVLRLKVLAMTRVHIIFYVMSAQVQPFWILKWFTVNEEIKNAILHLKYGICGCPVAVHKTTDHGRNAIHLSFCFGRLLIANPIGFNYVRFEMEYLINNRIVRAALVTGERQEHQSISRHF